MPITLSPRTETWIDARKLVTHVAAAFRRRCDPAGCLDWEELLADARLCYAKAAATFDPSRGEFRKRISACIWFGLLDLHRTRIKQARRRPAREDVPLEEVPERPRFDLEALLAEVSDDARQVVRLALRTRRGDRQTRLDWMRGLLTDLGWTAARVFESFAEITQAICE